MQPKLVHAGGRPKSDVKLTQVTFKADDETIAKLDEICGVFDAAAKALGVQVNGGKSQALRKMILDTYAALPIASKAKRK